MDTDNPNVFRGVDTPGHTRGMRIKRLHEASKLPFGVGRCHVTADQVANISLYQQDYTLEQTVRPDSESKRNNPHPSQRFMNWRVPRRLVDENVVQLSHILKSKESKLEQSTSTDQIKNNNRVSLDTLSRLSKRKLQPPYVFGPTPSPTGSSSSGSGDSVEGVTHRNEGKLQRCQMQGGKRVFVPSVLPAVNKWMEIADNRDKRVVSDIITAADESGIAMDAAEIFHSRALPGVEKWLQNADKRDRKVAAKFFTSLSEQKEKTLQTDSQYKMRMMNALRLKRRREWNNNQFGILPPSMSRLMTKSRHLAAYGQQLLDRKAHQLPIPPNKTAMFTRPQLIVGRHFSIHPEWGLR